MNDMENKLTFNLIIKRNLNGVLDQGDSSNDKVEVISSLTHVRLDRENICVIDNLDALANVTNLYLQGNKIEKIQNLECLSPTLKFLTLSQNKIVKIEGLKMLHNLGFLDLSENKIVNIDYSQLPSSIVFVAFEENPCSQKPNYKKELKENLPQLKSLDNELLYDSCEDTDSEDENEQNGTEQEEGGNLEEVKMVGADLLDRSVRRLDEMVEEHRRKIGELKSYRENLREELKTPRSSRGHEGDLKDFEAKLKETIEKVMKAESDGRQLSASFDIAKPRPAPQKVPEKPAKPAASKPAKKKKEAIPFKIYTSSGTSTSSKSGTPTASRSKSAGKQSVRIPGARPFSLK